MKCAVCMNSLPEIMYCKKISLSYKFNLLTLGVYCVPGACDNDGLIASLQDISDNHWN